VFHIEYPVLYVAGENAFVQKIEGLRILHEYPGQLAGVGRYRGGSENLAGIG